MDLNSYNEQIVKPSIQRWAANMIRDNKIVWDDLEPMPPRPHWGKFRGWWDDLTWRVTGAWKVLTGRAYAEDF